MFVVCDCVVIFSLSDRTDQPETKATVSKSLPGKRKKTNTCWSDGAANNKQPANLPDLTANAASDVF